MCNNYRSGIRNNYLIQFAVIQVKYLRYKLSYQWRSSNAISSRRVRKLIKYPFFLCMSDFVTHEVRVNVEPLLLHLKYERLCEILVFQSSAATIVCCWHPLGFVMLEGSGSHGSLGSSQQWRIDKSITSGLGGSAVFVWWKFNVIPTSQPCLPERVYDLTSMVACAVKVVLLFLYRKELPKSNVSALEPNWLVYYEIFHLLYKCTFTL